MPEIVPIPIHLRPQQLDIERVLPDQHIPTILLQQRNHRLQIDHIPRIPATRNPLPKPHDPLISNHLHKQQMLPPDIRRIILHHHRLHIDYLHHAILSLIQDCANSSNKPRHARADGRQGFPRSAGEMSEGQRGLTSPPNPSPHPNRTNHSPYHHLF